MQLVKDKEHVRQGEVQEIQVLLTTKRVGSEQVRHRDGEVQV